MGKSMVFLMGTVLFGVALGSAERVRAQDEHERIPALFSDQEREMRLNQLSEEERQVIRERHLPPGAIDRLLDMKDEFMRKSLLGVDEVQKFFHQHRIVVPPEDLYHPIALAKYSDCVVMGTVKEVKGHPEEPYHTWVTVSVGKYLKGGEGKDEVVVKLISGLSADGTGIGFSNEPEFKEGERVLLHLRSLAMNLHTHVIIHPERFPPGNPYRTVKICEGYFELNRKFLLEEGKEGHPVRVIYADGQWDLDEVLQGIGDIMKGD